MKTKVNVMKKVLGFVLTLVIMYSMLPMTSNAAEGTTVYFKPNSNWVSYGAWVSAYCFTDGGGNEWINLTDTDGDGYYVGTVPGGYEKIIFTRMNPAYDTKEWNKWENGECVEEHVWTQTANLDVPTAGAPCCFVIVDGGWEAGAWSHAYTDGVCTLCGEYENGMGKLTGHSLSLTGNIGINYYMDLDPDVKADGSGAYMQFTYPDSTTKSVYVSDVTPDGNTYKFTCEVAAKEMTDSISAKLIWGTKEYNAGTYSVKEYADTIIADTTTYDAKTRELATAMLDYGGYAQTYFKHNTNNLANEGFATLGTVDLSSYAATTTGSLGTFKANLLLNSETTLKVYFTPAEGVEVSSISVGSESVELVKSGNDYVVTIADINATELDKAKEITVTAANSSTTKLSNCSPLTYGNSVLSADDNSELSNVVTALRIFNQKAVAYVTP